MVNDIAIDLWLIPISIVLYPKPSKMKLVLDWNYILWEKMVKCSKLHQIKKQLMRHQIHFQVWNLYSKENWKKENILMHLTFVAVQKLEIFSSIIPVLVDLIGTMLKHFFFKSALPSIYPRFTPFYPWFHDGLNKLQPHFTLSSPLLLLNTHPFFTWALIHPQSLLLLSNFTSTWYYPYIYFTLSFN